MADTRISVSGLAKRFGALRVFEDVDLTVGTRECLAVVGPSGCGKTTLLRCLDGLITPSAGQVLIDGVPVESPPPGVAMVFQHFGLLPWKTVFENVAYGLRMAGTSRAEVAETVPRYIKLVGLEGFEKSYPYQLSGGMRQRTGLARALAVEPDVLLMDEPFTSVDAQTRELLQFELLRIWESRPTSMVFVTHSIEEAVLMGDRILVLKDRPARVHETVEVGLPRPRTREVLSSARFGEVREHVWNALAADVQHRERDLRTGYQ